MFLRSLKLNQFRCFESLRLQFSTSEKTTVFVGDNAQGKTSILEAICVLLRLQSPRSASLGDCQLFGSEGFAISGEIGDSQLRLRHTASGRKLFVDDELQKTADYLKSSGLVVWMANDDLSLVRGGGDGRRRFLDFMASQLYPAYRPALKAYEKALRTRNFLLKRDASPKWPEIDAYTRILAEQGSTITELRRKMILELQPYASDAQRHISSIDSEALALTYRCGSGEDSEPNLSQILFSLRTEEYNKRATAAGPHRDDLELALDHRPASKFASEGQQRTLSLALKLAQAKLFESKRDQPPILLIDDVFGELDPGRRNALMTAWPENTQKLITTTHLDWLDDAALGTTSIRRVKAGAIEA